MSRRDDDREDPIDREDTPTDAPPDTAALAPPLSPEYWQTYSPRFECPISYVLAALVVGLGVFLLLSVIWWTNLPPAEFKPGPKIGLTDGNEAFGDGEAGSGGQPDPLVLGQNAPTRDDMKQIVPDIDTKLPQVKDDLAQKWKLEDPTSTTPLRDDKVAPLAALSDTLRDKLSGLGAPKGEGGEKGKGGVGGNPDGAGTGTGSDSTRARTMRWVIVFRTAGGRDYLDQIQSLGAKVIVPLADGKTTMLFRTLNGDPPVGKVMTEADWPELSGLVQFSDYTPDSNVQVGQALGMGKLPKGFWAFFPKELEKELARKEVGFQQRRAEDIEETKFEFTRRSGKAELVVVSQKIKR